MIAFICAHCWAPTHSGHICLDGGTRLTCGACGKKTVVDLITPDDYVTLNDWRVRARAYAREGYQLAERLINIENELAGERKGRALLAKATDRINDLESQIQSAETRAALYQTNSSALAGAQARAEQLRTAIEACLYNDGHLPGCLGGKFDDPALCHVACQRLRAVLEEK